MITKILLCIGIIFTLLSVALADEPTKAKDKSFEKVLEVLSLQKCIPDPGFGIGGFLHDTGNAYIVINQIKCTDNRAVVSIRYITDEERKNNSDSYFTIDFCGIAPTHKIAIAPDNLNSKQRTDRLNAILHGDACIAWQDVTP